MSVNIQANKLIKNNPLISSTVGFYLYYAILPVISLSDLYYCQLSRLFYPTNEVIHFFSFYLDSANNKIISAIPEVRVFYATNSFVIHSITANLI